MGRTIRDTYEIESRAETRGVDQAEDSIDRLINAIQDNTGALQGTERAADGASDAIDRVADSALDAVAAFAGMELAGMAFDQISDAVGSVIVMEDAMNLLQAQTGASAAEMDMYRDIANDVFTQNWGESLGDVTDVMSQVARITGLQGEALQNATIDAIAFSDAFDADVTESVRAVDTMVEQFGIDADYAFDLLAYGMQQTGDPADDLLDTFNEYSGNFADMGITADQAFRLLSSGMEGGARNFDDIADATREFNIRMQEGAAGSDAFREAFLALGPDAAGVWSDFEAGYADGADMINVALDMLRDIEDPIERNRIGVELFGSKFEDMGWEVFEAMTLSGGAIEGVEGTMDSLESALSQGIGPAWSTFTRIAKQSLTEAITPIVIAVISWLIPALTTAGNFISGKLIPTLVSIGKTVAKTVLPYLEDFVDFIEPIIESIQDWIGDNPEFMEVLGAIALGIGGVIAVMTVIGPIIGVLTTGFAIFGGILALVFSPLALLVGALAGFYIAYQNNFLGFGDAVDAAYQAVATAFSGIREWINTLINVFQTSGIEGVVQMFAGLLVNAFFGLTNTITTALSGLDDILGTNFLGPFQNIIDNVVALFSGDGNLATNLLNLGGSIVGWLLGLGGQLATALLTPFEGVIADVLAFFGVENPEGLAHAIVTFPSNLATWLSDVGSNLGTYLEGPFNTAVEFVKNLFGASGVAGSLATSIRQSISPTGIYNLFSDVATSLSTYLLQPFTNIVNSIIGLFTGELSLTEALTGVVSGIAGIFTGFLQLLTDYIYTPFLTVVDNILALFGVDSQLATTFTGLIDLIVGFIGDPVGALSEIGRTLLTSIGDFFSEAVLTVRDNLRQGLNDMIPDRVEFRFPRVETPAGTIGGGSIGINLPNPFALGGLFAAGEFMMTGEKGVELLVPSQSGMVVSNDQLATALSIMAGGIDNVATLLNAGDQFNQNSGTFILETSTPQQSDSQSGQTVFDFRGASLMFPDVTNVPEFYRALKDYERELAPDGSR